eukprot:gnl/MRDRNA2_/MRDRNA2_34219_c0_seq1.p1 gnl/MRDRNA2_/MRDRNA2_34219_c0~~gnl/MRDRNA2_/MRDRNA2_34219_c0_seq1.p1  ORF type:complete len:305 (+),score=55.12 gnl/MRDRNA2_/MRDRNA2_34219_c0_seq1:139-1053(+)
MPYSPILRPCAAVMCCMIVAAGVVYLIVFLTAKPQEERTAILDQVLFYHAVAMAAVLSVNSIAACWICHRRRHLSRQAQPTATGVPLIQIVVKPANQEDLTGDTEYQQAVTDEVPSVSKGVLKKTVVKKTALPDDHFRETVRLKLMNMLKLKEKVTPNSALMARCCSIEKCIFESCDDGEAYKEKARRLFLNLSIKNSLLKSQILSGDVDVEQVLQTLERRPRMTNHDMRAPVLASVDYEAKLRASFQKRFLNEPAEPSSGGDGVQAISFASKAQRKIQAADAHRGDEDDDTSRCFDYDNLKFV